MSRRGAIALAFVAVLASAAPLGCALGGGKAGGSRDLPGQPIIPWTTVDKRDPCDDVASPVALQAQDGDVAGPWALAVDGKVWLYFSVQTAPGVSEIRRVESADGVHFDAAAVKTVFAADAAWEAGHVALPAVLLRENAGGARTFELYYVGGEGAGIGRATSSDGVSWTREAAPLLEPREPWEKPGLGRPAPLRVGAATWLWYGVRDATAVGLARADGDGAFSRDAGAPVLSGTTDAPVSTPYIEHVPTPSGRLLLRMWYGHGKGGTLDGVGVAGAFAPTTWEQYPDNPALSSPAGQPLSPSRVDLESGRYLYMSWLVRTPQLQRVLAVAFSGLAGPTDCATP